MKIGFVFTNYNNSQYTRKAIHSISLNENWNNCYIVIVDNCSKQADIEQLEAIKKDYPSIRLVLNQENVGYFKGLNIGLTLLRDTVKDLDHIVIGNNDLVFPVDFCRMIEANSQLFTKYPVISPNIITLDGVHQNPHVISKISKIREAIYDIYYSNYYMSVIIDVLARATKKLTDRDDEQQFNIAQTIYQGYGACYILGPLFFKYFNLLWAPTFLMGEEFFISKQLSDKNFKIYYEPTIIVRHYEHASVSSVPSKKFWKISRDAHKVYRSYIKILD